MCVDVWYVCVRARSPPLPHGPHAGAAGGCRPPQCPGGTSTSLAAGGCRPSQCARPRPSTSPAPCPAGMPLSRAGKRGRRQSRAAVTDGAGRARVHAMLQARAAGRGAAGSSKARYSCPAAPSFPALTHPTNSHKGSKKKRVSRWGVGPGVP